jgi:hypothetical protein
VLGRATRLGLRCPQDVEPSSAVASARSARAGPRRARASERRGRGRKAATTVGQSRTGNPMPPYMVACPPAPLNASHPRTATPVRYMAAGGQLGDTTRSKRGETWRNDAATSPNRSALFAGIKGSKDDDIVCLPCRRSWVRVPSAAWKSLQIGSFVVVATVSVVRRRCRVRSPSADLGKAPANGAVPAASNQRFARADEGFLEPGDDGTEPSAPE